MIPNHNIYRAIDYFIQISYHHFLPVGGLNNACPTHKPTIFH